MQGGQESQESAFTHYREPAERGDTHETRDPVVEVDNEPRPEVAEYAGELSDDVSDSDQETGADFDAENAEEQDLDKQATKAPTETQLPAVKPGGQPPA